MSVERDFRLPYAGLSGFFHSVDDANNDLGIYSGPNCCQRAFVVTFSKYWMITTLEEWTNPGNEIRGCRQSTGFTRINLIDTAVASGGTTKLFIWYFSAWWRSCIMLYYWSCWAIMLCSRLQAGEFCCQLWLLHRNWSRWMARHSIEFEQNVGPFNHTVR